MGPTASQYTVYSWLPTYQWSGITLTTAANTAQTTINPYIDDSSGTAASWLSPCNTDESAATTIRLYDEYYQPNCYYPIYHHTGAANSFCIDYSDFVVDPKEQKFAEFRRQREAKINRPATTRTGLGPTEDFAENKARLLLRTLIGAERFRRYMKDGFLSVKSPTTGLTYQVFPGHKSVVVYEDGKRTASCCIVFQDSSLPPTDWVIMRMSLIVADETTFYRTARVSGQIPERIRMAA